jgi:hypothetical protein
VGSIDMTLIVAMPTADALVIAADKRLGGKGMRTVDDLTKIVQLGPETAGTVYGAARLLDRSASRVAFNIFELMSDFFADSPFSIDTLGDFRGFAKDRFAQYCRSCDVRSLSFRNGRSLLQLAVFTRLGREFRIFRRHFEVAEDGSLGCNVPFRRSCKIEISRAWREFRQRALENLVEGQKG